MGELRQRLPKNVGFTKAELKRYLDYIGALGQVHGCVLCGAPSIVAHVKYSEHCAECEGQGVQSECVECQGTFWRYGKVHGLRQHLWSLPLCPNHHTEAPGCQHSANEQAWWAKQGIDALALCVALQDAYNTGLSMPDKIEGGVIVLEEFRRAA